MAELDSGAWDSNAAMSGCAQSADPAAAYGAICAGRRDGPPELQSTWALPHHSHPGDPANADGVRAALSRFSQTQGLVNAEAAQAHLDAHMAQIRDAMNTRAEGEPEPELQTVDFEGDLQVRDLAAREIGIRIVPWNTVSVGRAGPEMFVPGAFDGIDPTRVVLRLEHQNPPAGRGIALEQRSDGAHMVFRVSQTQRGDEILALAADGVTRGASVGYYDVPGGTEVTAVNGRRTRTVRRASLREVSTTWQPTWEQSAVMYVRSTEPETEIAEMAETQEVAAAAAAPAPQPVDLSPITAQLAAMGTSISDRFAALEERSRADIVIPAAQPAAQAPDSGVWMSAVLRMLSGERIPEMQMRDLADLVTTDNIGVVPPAYLSEVIGVINRRRPFMETTRHLGTPTAGMSLVVPRIVTRPTAGQQMAEKDELTSTKTEIDTVTFDAVTKGGAGDISLQLLKRSSPSFLQMYLDLLFEAYAQDAEIEAVAALLGLGSGGFGSGGFGNGGVNDGGTLDPNDLNLGTSWLNGYVAMYGGPDTIWMSSEAVGAFIDAKATTTNQPLYSNLQANITAAGGLGGNISGLRPVHVPALNGTGVDVLVGPSNGFAWAEDGTYTLQVDVPAKAGRDVAVVGILWFAPLYPTAFTGWALAGS